LENEEKDSVCCRLPGPWDPSPCFSRLVLGILIILYGLVVAFHFSEAYIDFGDGNYLYISSRLADGLVLYRDIMAPQPPCHLYLGSLLIRLGRGIGSPLYTVRAFSLLLHLATMLVIFLIGKKVFGKRLEGLIAAFLFLILPIGFWWSQGYQSEGLLIFLLVLSFYFYIDFSPGSMRIAAILGTLAMFTNMTAAPYVFFNTLYLLFRKRRLFLHYFLPMLVLVVVGILFMEAVTQGHYLENVFFNQVGTFPHPKLNRGMSVWNYAFGKIVNEGKDIMTWEGGYILFCLVGMILFLLRGENREGGREYIGWYVFFSLCSIVFVSKGGTMEYIFTIGEPFVVLFFAHAIALFWRGPLYYGAAFRCFEWKDSSRLVSLVILVFLLIANFYIGIFYIRNTLRGDTYELSDAKIREVKEIINTHTRRGDAILAPPYYAFITGRRIVEEYSENYIWTIKYVNEMYVQEKPGDGVKKALAIAKSLSEKKVPLVLLDMAQTGKIPPIMQEIEKNYEPLKVWNGSHILQTLNPAIGFYVPKKD